MNKPLKLPFVLFGDSTTGTGAARNIEFLLQLALRRSTAISPAPSSCPTLALPAPCHIRMCGSAQGKAKQPLIGNIVVV